jgi:hypothetical protein
LYSFFTILGIYFHPFVLFASANGIAWLALSSQKSPQVRAQRIGLLFSLAVCLLAFLAGYLTFSASNFFTIPLMVFEKSPLSALAAGLGWFPYSEGSSQFSWLWGGLSAVLEMAGMIITIRRQPLSPLAGLFYSLILQVGAVIGSDLLGHYFYAPRQFIMLLPLLCLFAGLGANAAIEEISRSLRSARQNLRPEILYRMAVFLTALCLLLTSLPAIRDYQEDDKGNSRVISQLVLQAWRPGDILLVIPGYDSFVYKYYIEYVFGRTDVARQLFTADWEDVSKRDKWAGKLFVITPYELDETQAEKIDALELAQAYHSNPYSRYAKILWLAPKNQP